MCVIDTISTFFPFSTLKVSLFLLLPSGLALLGCCVSNEAMQAVEQVLESICPKLNLHAQFPVKTFETANQAKHYLEEHSLQFCVLVVDGKTVKDAYNNITARKVEYENLLKTAVASVGKISVNCKCEKTNQLSAFSFLYAFMYFAYVTILTLHENSFFLFFQPFSLLLLIIPLFLRRK